MSSVSSTFPRHRLAMRWLAVLSISILLHLLAGGWVSGNLALPQWQQQDPPAVMVQLQKSMPAAAPKPARPKPKPAAKPRHAPHPHPKPAAPPPAVAEPDLPQAPAGSESVPPASEPVAETPPPAQAAEPQAQTEAGPRTEAIEPVIEPQQVNVPLYRVSLPASVELKYDVQALHEEKIVYGSGKLKWQYDGESYAVEGQAGILFFTLLNFKSSGVVDDFGVAPVIYSEKRFRKPETNTHFSRTSDTISFSASTASYPRKGGEQDRASLIWQLAGIGRGDGEKFTPGAQFELFVAGVRDAEPWLIRVIGMERIEAGIGQVDAWHLERAPRPGSHEQKLDIWLAPQNEWYPVRLRFTETNGNYLDMSLSKSALLDAH